MIGPARGKEIRSFDAANDQRRLEAFYQLANGRGDISRFSVKGAVTFREYANASALLEIVHDFLDGFRIRSRF